MNLRSLLSTPCPPHAFVLDERRLSYGRLSRRRDAFERVEGMSLPGGWSSLGPIGLLHVDREALGGALTELLGRIDRRPSRASLVVPSIWVRSVTVDVGVLPGQRQEAEEVIRWRLKKLLPCRPEDVRLDYLPLGGNGHVMVLLALERPFAAIEETFTTAQLHLGRVVPEAVALTALLPPGVGRRLLAVINAGSLALVATVDGEVRLLRHKALPAATDRLGLLLGRELSQTVEYMEGDRAGGRLELHLASASPAATSIVTGWALARPDITVHAFKAGGEGLPATGDGVDLHPWLLLAAAKERLG